MKISGLLEFSKNQGARFLAINVYFLKKNTQFRHLEVILLNLEAGK